ncbi:hypothetical protein F3Y22_tig00111840pilonHSYRG00033 [Hibiscus syriacus]|uniref:RNase H type-1 domain-containing protein n=1 Tax=Hibiscus syriacus TaxID=106335 RepID=A0A6A2YFR4_HIBSY|nr:uncharacterized protein LOC120171964 [Hibiscus syriacus]KAE8672514.1 hypothetical protein F3Y22_tig00111840pilonHSYRG00033 [Hibiscus syriacus]
MGFSRAIGICSVIEAELWGVFEGLKHARRIRARNIAIEIDNIEAHSMLTRRHQGLTAPSILHIWELMEGNWSVTLSYVPREANKLDDIMAKLVQKDDFAGRIFEKPPEAIRSILQEDRLGLMAGDSR